MCEKKADKALKKREQIDKKYKWNIEAMFPDENDWDKDFQECLKDGESYISFSGHLGDNAKTLLDALTTKDRIWQKLERVYVYAHMRKDEDNRVSKYQAMSDKCHGLIAKVSASMSFFTPELLEIPEDTLLSFIKEEAGLKIYEFVIKDTLRLKAHVLTKPEENILAQMGEITSATNDIFTMLNNADMKFAEIMDDDGDMVEVTSGNFISFMESYNRDIRKAAFDSKYKSYMDLINTIATTYNYNTKTDVVGARIRKYPSALMASLSGDNIEKEVYTNLVDVVNENLPVVHKYMELRKKLLGVDELHMYDVYVPLVEMPERVVSYEEALDIMRDGLSVLGEEYIARMNNGIKNGWIDVFENEGKTSGAYSFGSYDSFPYILLNYNNKLKDVFTVVHEMGHSMHSSYTREVQPFAYGSHSIFTAEVASTVNESLLMKYLLKIENEKLLVLDKNSKEYKDALAMKKYLLNLHIEEFRTTLFRQTMFAEFELMAHEAVESGEVLTAEWMCEKYGELNARYFGPSMVNDEQIKYEWARIPHFYNAFYVYKYATGYSAASAISEKIIKEGAPARDAYKKFLTTGESNYPIELLKIAGVDMSTKEPIEDAMKIFADLVDEFEKLVTA